MLTGALAIAAAAVAVGVVVYVVNTLTYAGSTNTTPDCQLVGFPTNVDRCQNEGSPSTHR
jgi:hypothetical protein